MTEPIPNLEQRIQVRRVLAAALDAITPHLSGHPLNHPSRHLPMVPLTPRQIDVLRGLADGLTYERIGARHDIDATTVKRHVQILYRRLDARSGAHAVHLGHLQGHL